MTYECAVTQVAVRRELEQILNLGILGAVGYCPAAPRPRSPAET